MTESPLVYILIPVHNRKATTLACLDTLQRNEDLDRYRVVVIDDGSTDGTSNAVRTTYPTVTLLQGEGDLWWTGAIEQGMRYAHQQGAHYFIWLNDDTLPDPGTIPSLVSFCQAHPAAIAASQCYDGDALTYGGQQKTQFSQTPIHAGPREELECDVLDGNLVCIPSAVVSTIGFPEGKAFPHYGGDNFYTWKAQQKGFKNYLLGSSRSFCPRDHQQERWLMGEEGIWTFWRRLNSPKCPFYWRTYPAFCIRYWGFWGIVALLIPYLRLFGITLARLILPPKLIHQLRNLVLSANSVNNDGKFQSNNRET